MTVKDFLNIYAKNGTVVEGPMGLKMPERLARAIEDRAKTLPADFTYRRRSFAAKQESSDADDRTEVSVISSDAVDRDIECVLPAGGDWSTFNKCVPFCHDYSALPVGYSHWIRATGRTLKAKTQYPLKPDDWDGQPWLPSAIWHLMNQPVPMMGDKSIGFLPLNVRGATAEEKAKRPELEGVPVIDKWVGLEYSVVLIGANQDARIEAIAKCLKDGSIDSRLSDLVISTSKTIVSMNGVAMPKTDKGMTESDNPSGGVMVDEGKTMPSCPKCLCADAVKLEPPPPGTESPCDQYKCWKCGTMFEKTKDDDGGGEDEMSLAAPAPEAKNSSGAVPENQVESPVQVPMLCPGCQEPMTKGEDKDVSGLGMCDTFKCEKCQTTVIVPRVAKTGVDITKAVETGKEAGEKKLNPACESRAMSAVKDGRMNDGEWIAPNGGDRKAEDCLGIREGADVEPSAKYTDPIFKGGELYRRAVADVESRESGSTIGEAAKRIMAAIQARDQKAVKPVYSQATIDKAIADAKAAKMDKYLSRLDNVLVDAVSRRLGRV